MKKKLFIILSIVLVLGLIVTAIVFLLPKNDEKNSGAIENESEVAMQKLITDIKSTSEFNSFVEKYSYEFGITDDKSVGSIYNVSFLGENTYSTFYFDSKGNTTDISLFYYLNATDSSEKFEVDELSIETLSEKSRGAIEKFCKMFNCDFVTDLYLANNDGTFTKIESDENFQAIIDGTSYLDFTLRDVDGFYWKLNISCEEKLAVVNICKYFSVEEYKNHVANISLYEGE